MEPGAEADVGSTRINGKVGSQMDDREQHVNTTEARAGTTPHMTRVILPISLALVVILFAILLFAWR